ncbi:hypothetical protein [Neobacillus muris]|uniref:hypothetical protein n=1 Tax=Neobacillus muris TaxID=2941334 RepID=UPI002040B903|nr:hypothetical protein [Neobacillus muris]
MIKLALGNINITRIGPSAGIFLGEKNTLKTFQSKKITNEVVGKLDGNRNMILESYWIIGNGKREDE